MCKQPAIIFNRSPTGFNCNYGALRAIAPLPTNQEVGSSNLSGRAFYQCPRTINRHVLFVALSRTPDIKHAEFDDSAAKRRWRSPIGRAERQRGQGAEGPAAISPGAHFTQAREPSIGAYHLSR
jgi:hypothetical protein